MIVLSLQGEVGLLQKAVLPIDKGGGGKNTVILEFRLMQEDVKYAQKW